MYSAVLIHAFQIEMIKYVKRKPIDLLLSAKWNVHTTSMTIKICENKQANAEMSKIESKKKYL